MSDNPNITLVTEAYRYDVSMLRHTLHAVVSQLADLGEDIALTPFAMPPGEHAVMQFRYEEALDHLLAIEVALGVEATEGVVCDA